MTVGASLPGSSFAIAGSAERGACSMMYLLPLHLLDAVDAHQQAARSTPAFRRRSAPACGSAPPGSRARSRPGAGDSPPASSRSRPDRRSDRRARGAARSRPSPESTTTSAAMPCSREKAPQNVRIGRGDALALQRLRAAILEAVRHRDAQPAAAEVQQLHRLEQAADAARVRTPGASPRRTLRPTSPRSQTSSCTRSGMSSSRTNSTSSGMFSP